MGIDFHFSFLHLDNNNVLGMVYNLIFLFHLDMFLVDKLILMMNNLDNNDLLYKRLNTLFDLIQDNNNLLDSNFLLLSKDNNNLLNILVEKSFLHPDNNDLMNMKYNQLNELNFDTFLVNIVYKSFLLKKNKNQLGNNKNYTSLYKTFL